LLQIDAFPGFFLVFDVIQQQAAVGRSSVVHAAGCAVVGKFSFPAEVIDLIDG
jgi:hypothetical protein